MPNLAAIFAVFADFAGDIADVEAAVPVIEDVVAGKVPNAAQLAVLAKLGGDLKKLVDDIKAAV